MERQPKEAQNPNFLYQLNSTATLSPRHSPPPLAAAARCRCSSPPLAAAARRDFRRETIDLVRLCELFHDRDSDRSRDRPPPTDPDVRD